MPDLAFYLLVFLVVGVVFLFFHLMLGKMIRPYRPDAEKMTIYECGEPTVGSAWIQFDLRYYVVALLFVVFDVEVAFFFPWAVVFGKANELAQPDSQLVAKDRDGNTRDRKAITKELVPAELNLAFLEAPEAPKPPAVENGEPKMKAAGRQEDKGDDKKADKAAEKKTDKGADKKEQKGGGKKGKQDGQGKKDQAKEAGPAAGPGIAVDLFPSAAQPKDVTPIDADTAREWAWIAFYDIGVFFGVLMVGFAYLWKRGDIDWVRSTAAEREVG